MHTDYNLKEITLAAFEEFILVTEQQAEMKPAADKWSPKEILGHLIDSASNNHGRFIRAQFTDDLVAEGYAQEQWVEIQEYHQQNWQDLLILWRQLNLHLTNLMYVTSEEQRFKKRHHHNLDQIAFYHVQKTEPTTLDYFMQDYVVHLKHHLGQIREIIFTEE